MIRFPQFASPIIAPLHAVIEVTSGHNLSQGLICCERVNVGNYYHCGKNKVKIKEHLLLLDCNDGVKARGWRKCTVPKRSRSEHLFLLESMKTQGKLEIERS